MTGLFAEWQPRYAERGLATFPVREKRPAVRGYLKLGLATSSLLAEKFSNADAFGFAVGKCSNITILDVDTTDEKILADALDKHGPTPIIVRSGSGNYQAWYRWNGERRTIRPDRNPAWPVDILGGGYVVGPPSRGIKSNYQFMERGLDDLDRLPILRVPNITPPLLSSASMPDEIIIEGNRNNALWRHCMRSARHCDDFDAALDVARTCNDQFSPPLPDYEVIKIVRSAWTYTELGENRFGQHGVFFTTGEVNQLLAADPDVLMLKLVLKANNGPDREFMIANGMCERMRWGRKRFARARLRLEQQGVIVQVRPPTTENGPALYRWRRGGQN